MCIEKICRGLYVILTAKSFLVCLPVHVHCISLNCWMFQLLCCHFQDNLEPYFEIELVQLYWF